jgi:hypothetical protein
MNDADFAKEVKRLILWYEKRGKNWLLAAEFILSRRTH